MPAVIYTCSVASPKEGAPALTNNGRATHITVAFFYPYAHGEEAAKKAEAVVSYLKQEADEKKIKTLVLKLENKRKPTNRSYPIVLEDATKWIYKYNAFSDSPREPHVELIGVDLDLTGCSLTVDLGSLHVS